MFGNIRISWEKLENIVTRSKKPSSNYIRKVIENLRNMTQIFEVSKLSKLRSSSKVIEFLYGVNLRQIPLFSAVVAKLEICNSLIEFVLFSHRCSYKT